MSRNSSVSLFLVVVLAAGAYALPSPVALKSQRNYIDDMIIKALENLKNQMTEGWPTLGIPPLDPLDLGHLTINISNSDARVLTMMRDVKVNGLSTFNIDQVHSNILLFKVNVDLGIPTLGVDGQYNVTGQAGLFPLYGEGPFSINAHNVTLSVMIDFGQIDNSLGVTELKLDINSTAVDFHFEGIMGGGMMGDMVNDLLNTMAPQILQGLEDKYMPLLEEVLKNEINKVLQGSVRKVKDESVNDYFDLVFANMRLSMIENGRDPLILPLDSDNFTITLFNKSVSGWVQAGPGRLSGVSSVHRAGDMAIYYYGDQGEVAWQGEVGLIDLQLDYKFELALPLFGKDLSLTAKLSFIHLSFETDVFLNQSEIKLAYCNVTELGPIHVKETGAGPLDTALYNLLANTLLGELQGVVATAVQEVVCNLLEGALASG